MINSIINAISIALNAEFGSDCTIYSEAIAQGLQTPCFFIYCINPANRQYFGKRWWTSRLRGSFKPPYFFKK